VRSKREVHYVVSRLTDPDDPEGGRDPVGWYPFLELAKREADRLGPCGCVDAEGGTYFFDGSYGRRTQWQADWTNRNVYQGRLKRSRAPQISPISEHSEVSGLSEISEL
jgi:hypothetical protein